MISTLLSTGILTIREFIVAERFPKYRAKNYKHSRSNLYRSYQ
ncbi:hypothetical protein [Fusobacterium sp.]|nr:hypothetical protein [Fusobacterium sp.]